MQKNVSDGLSKLSSGCLRNVLLEEWDAHPIMAFFALVIALMFSSILYFNSIKMPGLRYLDEKFFICFGVTSSILLAVMEYFYLYTVKSRLDFCRMGGPVITRIVKIPRWPVFGYSRFGSYYRIYCESLDARFSYFRIMVEANAKKKLRIGDKILFLVEPHSDPTLSGEKKYYVSLAGLRRYRCVFIESGRDDVLTAGRDAVNEQIEGQTSGQKIVTKFEFEGE